ncbi:TPA: hypothetical protein QHR59_000116 [Klebsiella aerogenes]|uniref:hypothetical protein n=1 Tax=Klebsiella aerogenes TaxID=548 RepID=UPI00063CEBEE|nr:hypothetical protein [Klebsiella aerogenes]ATM90547.1 hypothetical protein CRN78_08445 [Klebsiella aerogenes]EIV5430707.1 hypothetical protein [Klebsiella aerogenes]EKU4979933.1 hypothetical protein [Klebsiella aerogenes]ELA0241952.1 hypothetical protein [Klebsiella aerogenes]ELA0935423.1 hypothetical protein [Klebsiella aerogenes]
MIDINKLLASLKRRSSHIKEFGDDITFVKLEDLDALVEALDKAQETIAFQQGEIKALLSSLESRTVTVKLPSLNPAMFNGDVMFGYHKAQKEAVEFCAAAGIKVEAE